MYYAHISKINSTTDIKRLYLTRIISNKPVRRGSIVGGQIGLAVYSRCTWDVSILYGLDSIGLIVGRHCRCETINVPRYLFDMTRDIS